MKIVKLKTLNESADELVKGTQSVMDHTLATAIKREAESKEKAVELIDNKVKEFSIEDREAHTKGVKTPEMKKMYLSESLFEYYEENEDDTSWIEDLIDYLEESLSGMHNDDEFFKELRKFYDKYMGIDDIKLQLNVDEDETLDEAIDGNTSHAQEFVSALRSA